MVSRVSLVRTSVLKSVSVSGVQSAPRANLRMRVLGRIGLEVGCGVIRYEA